MNPLCQTCEIIRGQTLRWDQMRELECGNDPHTKTEVAGAGRQVIVSSGEEGAPCTIELKRTFSGLMQIDIVPCRGFPDAEPGTARHGLRQAREIRPDVAFELTNDQIS